MRATDFAGRQNYVNWTLQKKLSSRWSSRTGKINAQLGNLPGALPLIKTQIILISIFCLSLHHRDTTPGNEKTSVMIREAIDLTRNNRIDLESLKSLHQVKTKDLHRNRKYYWGLGHIPCDTMILIAMAIFGRFLYVFSIWSKIVRILRSWKIYKSLVHVIQYCAKVMQTNFIGIRSLFLKICYVKMVKGLS